jgi:hypothetical protein
VGDNPVEQTAVPIFKACEIAGVSQRTIFEWIATGQVEYVRSRGGSMLILVDTLPPSGHDARSHCSTNRSPGR